jgi:hypothetical protein
MDKKRSEAYAFIRSHVPLVAKLFGRRFTATWLGTETPWRDFRSTDSSLIRAIFVGNALVAIGTLSGFLILFFRRNPYATPITVIPILFPIVYYITHTSLRYRHPMDPVLMLLTAIALTSIFGLRKVAPLSA